MGIILGLPARMYVLFPWLVPDRSPRVETSASMIRATSSYKLVLKFVPYSCNENCPYVPGRSRV